MKNNIFNIESGIMVPRTSDNRIIFVVPYQDYILIGTTDKLYEKTDYINPDESEVDYLVNELKNYFKIDEKIIRENITSKWAGLRPLFGETNLDNSGIIIYLSRLKIYFKRTYYKEERKW